jgi:hypothetical protein
MCGRCCPADCPHLVINSCDIHPNQHIADTKYGACEMGPIDLVLYRSIFCPPVLEVIKELTGVEVKADRNNLRFCKQESLNAALKTEVEQVNAGVI